MSDGQRTYPVNRLILHHSVGPFFIGENPQTVSDWFNSVGRNRGYKGVAHSGHVDPRTGQETFAQAHYALHESNGWKLVELIKEPFNNVAWHSGDWPMNQQSIGIEVCGNYVDKKLPPEALQVLADFWRPVDQSLGGKTFINGHRDFSPTQCPGQIKDQIPDILNLVNNPPKPDPIFRVFDSNAKQVGAYKIYANAVNKLINDLDYKGYIQLEDGTIQKIDKPAPVPVEPPVTPVEPPKPIEPIITPTAPTPATPPESEVIIMEKNTWSSFLASLRSRKFILAVVAAGVAGGNAFFGWGLTVEQVLTVIGPLMTYIGIEGYGDAKEREATATQPNPDVKVTNVNK